MANRFPNSSWILCFLCVVFSLGAAAQQTKLSCSQTNVPFVNGGTAGFLVTQSNDASGLSGWGTGVVNPTNTPANVINSTLTDFARGNILVTGSLQLSVKDASNDYNAGNFAGFVVDFGTLNAGLLGSLSIRTYLNTGTTRTLQETSTGSNIVSLGLLSGSIQPIGFYTNKAFDEVEINIGNGVGIGTYDVYYAILQGTGSCTSPALVCNANTALTFPAFATVVDGALTGTSGAVTLSAIANAQNVTDNNSANFASITTGVSVAGAAFLAVKDVTTDYGAGTYAGFDIENTALANVSLLSNLSIRTYKDGVFQEQQTGTGLLVGATVLNTSGRQKVGFVTTTSFDEVQLVVTQPAVGISLGTTRVYSAILKNLCAAAPLACNTPTSLSDTAAPVFINTAQTGISGVACLACGVEDAALLLDGDATTNATINLAVGAVASGSIAVKNALSTYAAGTFAGFDIESTALLDLSVLGNISVTTYLGGTLRETFSGNTLLAGVGSSLLGTAGRVTVGNLAMQSFDEIRLTVNQTAAVNLGNTKVYGVTLTNFCGGTIGCNSTYFLNNTAYPTFVNSRRTGVTGVACALCNVTDANNAVSASTTDYAVLSTGVGVLSTTSLSVQDAVSTYPAGTIAGFAIAETNNLLQVNLFKALVVSTYNNGVLQESRTAGTLLNLSALILQINPTTGLYNLGFQTTLPFNEVRISLSPLAGVAPVVRVYGAFIDTRLLSGSALGVICSKPPVAEADHISTAINTTIGGNLKTNDRDPQGEVLLYNTTAVTAPSNGTVALNADGTFTYTPNTLFLGLDSFQYQVCNASVKCATQWAYVSVMPASTPGGTNRAPLVQPDYSQTLVNKAVTGDARQNDNDPDGDPLTYSAITQPKNGLLVLNTNGTYTYTPDSSYVGTDTAVLQVCDNGTPALCRNSRLVLQVIPDTNGTANDAPFAQNDVVSGPSGKAINGQVLTNDSDPNGDALTVTLLDAIPPTSGTLYYAPNGNYSFVPTANFVGTVSTRYAVCDNGNPSLCDTATLTITLVPVEGPDFTPLLVFDSTDFTAAGIVKDFVVNISSLNANPSTGQLVFKMLKPSNYDITFSTATANSNVNGGTVVDNSNWTFSQNSFLITCTLNSGVVITGNSMRNVGFSIALKPGVNPGSLQNITTTIVGGTGGDSNNFNNQSTKNLRTK